MQATQRSKKYREGNKKRPCAAAEVRERLLARLFATTQRAASLRVRESKIIRNLKVTAIVENTPGTLDRRILSDCGQGHTVLHKSSVLRVACARTLELSLRSVFRCTRVAAPISFTGLGQVHELLEPRALVRRMKSSMGCTEYSVGTE
jgi:hypothetical protein